jgi:signal transduction histidine kinase
MIAAARRWLRAGLTDEDTERAPLELMALRAFLVPVLVFLIAETLLTSPHPALHGRGLAILIAMLVLVAGALDMQPRGRAADPRRVIGTLAVVTAATAVLEALQPNGVWPFGPVYVGIIAALRLGRRAAVAVLAISMATLVAVAEAKHHGGAAISVVTTAVPWFLTMRLLRAFREQRDQLVNSRAAEARAAAAAERGRIAREMHDVLAHSLSALALQLESTRLLARAEGADAELCRALDQAHHLAASGLQEARRAIAAARGEAMPGTQRLALLAEAFEEQSGLEVSVAVRGEPRELAPEAQLAVYRTAQEALTNVRRHAAADQVELTLDYLPHETVLVVADHGSAPPPVAVAAGLPGAGYGLTGMRERAELLGGELLARPTADGFRVRLRLPV